MQQTLEFQSPDTLPRSIGFSQIVTVRGGGLIFVSGQVAESAAGTLIGEGDFRAQVEQAFANLKTAVEAAGGSMHQLIKLSYFCVDTVDPSDYSAIREVRDRHVDTARSPASTFLVVRRLARPAWLIEIEAVAAAGAAS